MKLQLGKTYQIGKPSGDFHGRFIVRSHRTRFHDMDGEWYWLRFIDQEDGDENDWFEAEELKGLRLKEVKS